MSDNFTYYDYEGVPCRIHAADDGAHIAEKYLKNVGFVETSATDIHFEATPISEKNFKQMIVNAVY